MTERELVAQQARIDIGAVEEVETTATVEKATIATIDLIPEVDSGSMEVIADENDTDQ